MQSDIDALEHRVELIEGATRTLIDRTDRIQAEIKSFRSEVNLQFTEIRQDLKLIVGMLAKLTADKQDQDS